MRWTRLGAAAGAAVSVIALAGGCGSKGTGGAGRDDAAARTPSTSATAVTPGANPAPAPVVLPDGYDATRDANADIRSAVATAAKEHREVLIDFGANWCPDCRALDGMFRSPQVEPLLQKDYVVVAVDVGRFDRNLDVAGRYVDLQTAGIPALVVLKPDGTLRTATNDGSFSDARTMGPADVSAFLTRWAPGPGR